MFEKFFDAINVFNSGILNLEASASNSATSGKIFDSIEVFNFGILHMELNDAIFVFVVFVILMFALNTLLFKPLVRTLENRETEMEGHRKKEGGVASSISKAEAEYDAKLAEMKTEIDNARKSSRESATSQAKVIIDDVRSTVALIVEQSEKEIDSELNAAKGQVPALAKELSGLIVAKSLGKTA
ncbi:MAG: F-type H+-transporting ATPase subunit b [bacterium]|jgi:F-type H+-transporting ATPase subunit b